MALSQPRVGAAWGPDPDRLGHLNQDDFEGFEGNRSDCPRECQGAVFGQDGQDEPLRPNSDDGWVQVGEDKLWAGRVLAVNVIVHFDMLLEL